MGKTICRLAGITGRRQLRELDEAFRAAKPLEPRREEAEEFITEAFFDAMRHDFADMPRRFWQKYEQYLVLARRVGGISYVNMLGDIAMSANPNEGIG
jgi:hypothetical protein